MYEGTCKNNFIINGGKHTTAELEGKGCDDDNPQACFGIQTRRIYSQWT